VRDWFGEIDLFCSNAGIFIAGGIKAPDQSWERIVDVNFRAPYSAAGVAAKR
jgi:NAD(P)-dependent dehydrogenase (short-subunit alcohol dehydrogenase family)